MDPEPDVAPTESLFRPVKRRKFVRRRPDHDAEDTAHADSAIGNNETDSRAPETHSNLDTEDGIQTTGAVRFRRLHPVRKGGIGFSTTRAGNDHGQTAPEPAEDLEKEKIEAMCDRFTAHTGQTVDVDKHMMAYIDSEMARRFQHNLPPDRPEADRSTVEESGDQSRPGQQREPASLGKLHEIDLGQETKLQNIERTEAATRHLVGDEESADEATPHPDSSGQDGKSWRTRKRRTSADVERDRLVEEVLRESKLDVYDEPEDEPVDDQAADDRVAEQFRRDFMDAIQSRRRIARTRNTKTTKTEAPRGPKLGGSRSARAAMREMQGKAGQK